MRDERAWRTAVELVLGALVSLCAAAPAGATFMGLGDLPGGSFYSEANGVSADGSVVVGGSDSASGYQAFRWTQAGGMTGLGDLPGASFHSTAEGVSADGSVVVGYGDSGGAGTAFVWDAAHGMRNLRDLLVAQGDNLTGWSLYSALDVSGDGRTIVGYGTNPSGNTEAWLARVNTPEPGTLALLGAGLALAARRRRRRAA